MVGDLGLPNCGVHQLFNFLALVAPPLTFVLFAFLVTPTLAPHGELDLRDYYVRNQRWIFTLAALIFVELALVRMMLADEALLHPRNAVRALALSGAVWLAFAGALLYSAARGQF